MNNKSTESFPDTLDNAKVLFYTPIVAFGGIEKHFSVI